MDIQRLQLLSTLLESNSSKQIAIQLNVAPGTVTRWLELKNVPPAYQFDLMKMANVDINYANYTFKEKDQFFTPISTAEKCYARFLKLLGELGENESKYTYIEPSAGNGNFLKRFPSDRRIGLDIEPRDDEIARADYLTWKPPASSSSSKYIVFGNPPFGLRGQLALKFINYSYEFADYVCFILPQLFESDGKGAPRKRVLGYHLIHSEKITTDFVDPDERHIKVECIFQVWSKHHTNEIYDIREIDTSVVKIYSLSDGGTPSTTRNKSMFHSCHAYLPSTCFGRENMKYYTSFNALPGKKGYGIVFQKDTEENLRKFAQIDWANVAFLSTNSAYNIRTSQISQQFAEHSCR
jgi:hypothetical protein